jgi:hypothetical protein
MVKVGIYLFATNKLYTKPYIILVTFSALHSTSPSKEAVKPSGYTAQDDDDLDDLFDKHGKWI